MVHLLAGCDAEQHTLMTCLVKPRFVATGAEATRDVVLVRCIHSMLASLYMRSRSLQDVWTLRAHW